MSGGRLREGIQDITAKIGPYAGDLIKWFVAQVGGFGKLLVEFLLTVLIAAILYANGEATADTCFVFWASSGRAAR